MSQWHRDVFGDECKAFDLDLVGVCGACQNPLYVWETTRAAVKATTWTGRTAFRFNVPGFLIHYVSTDGELKELTAYRIYPRPQTLIGGGQDLQLLMEDIRRTHGWIFHGVAVV
jgi:hypothetical protein